VAKTAMLARSRLNERPNCMTLQGLKGRSVEWEKNGVETGSGKNRKKYTLREGDGKPGRETGREGEEGGEGGEKKAEPIYIYKEQALIRRVCAYDTR